MVMDLFRAYSLTVLCILSVVKGICGDSSVLFIDSPTGNYFRHSAVQTTSLSSSEISAVLSVLLGFPPPSTLTAASSFKLNEVLMPNPFNRPRVALMVEVIGAENSQVVDAYKFTPRSVLKFSVAGNEQRVDIHITDEDEMSLVSLNEETRNVECADNEISDFASWLGGSYVEDASKSLNGEFVAPLANGAYLRLLMSEAADREYVTSLLLLINKIRRTAEMHQVFMNGGQNPTELITGRFVGVKVLQDHYGSESMAQHGLEVFISSISKIYDTIQAAYQGKIVGVIIHGGSIGSNMDNMLHVTVSARSSARVLEETEALANQTKIAEVLFVRRTLAWITGIILLISTLLGIHFLLNMTLTKDTLLYSNVKLD